MKDKKVTGKSQHRFIKGRQCPIVLCYETTWSMQDGSTSDIIYLIFNKIFGMVSRNKVVDSLVN